MIKNDRLREILRNTGIISNIDYDRSFNKVTWTDMWLNTVEKNIDSDSKYILFLNSDLNEENIILSYPSLQEIVDVIYKRMIETNDVTGYDRNRHRVHVYYEDNGIIRIGNKVKDPITFQFEIPTIEDLIRKKNYLYRLKTLESKERHSEIQGLLINLGLSMGYKIKVASNDKSKLSKKANLKETTILNIEDLNIKNLTERVSKTRIDLIDIIWFDSDQEKIIAAFEVEFSKNYYGAYSRLGELNTHYSDYVSSIYSIIVGDDYNNAYEHSKMEVVKQNFTNNKLCYLNLENLANMLSIQDVLHSDDNFKSLRDAFFNDRTLIQMNKNIILLN